MNPFSFLGNIGGAIGGGAKQVGGMFAKGFKKLGELDQAGSGGGGMLKPPVPMTPGINPDAPMPELKGRGGMFGKGIDLINRAQPQAGSLPQLQRPDMPTLEPITDSASVSANLPMGQAEAPSLAGQMIAPRPIPSVRPPDFLGRKGATMDDTPLNHERYAYDNQYMENGHHGRRLQDIAMTALHGANQGFQATGDWRGALGGAGVGAAGAAINPLMARDFRFNQEQLPRITASRQELERGQDRSYEMQKRGADLEGSRARTQATIAATKDPQIERQYRQSQIAKMDADAEAKRTGKPTKFMDYDPESGQFRVAFKYPDGHVDYDGQSGDAELKMRGYENQDRMNKDRIEGGMARVKESAKGAMDRVRVQQGGANYRAGLSQSGQNARQKERLGAQYGDPQSSGVGEYGPAAPPAVSSVPFQPPVKPSSGAAGSGSARERFIQKAIEAGHSRAAAEAEATRRKY